MVRYGLFVTGLINFLASAALSQVPQFDINSLDKATQTRLLFELMATNGVDQQEIIDQIPSAKVMGMNQFEYKRFYDEEVLAIQNAPSLWRAGESVTLSFSSIAQLQNYDFDEGFYYFCVPTMHVPINASREGIWPPNVQIVFGPSNSTPGTGARAGGRCDPVRALWDYVGEGVFDFNLIRIKMNSDQAEQLYQQSLSFSGGARIIDISVTCIVGPGTLNGAYCFTESGFVGSATNTFPLDRYALAAETPSADSTTENRLLQQLIGKGVWSGSVSQPNSSTSYSVNLKWGEGQILVDYPELSCGGIWEFTSKVASTTWKFMERLDYGAGRCVDRGEVVIALSGPGVIRYEWSRAGRKIVEATADLQYTGP